MDVFYLVCQWLLILALIGFFATIAWIVMTVLKVKTAVMGDAKRLYEPPLRSGKAVAATGKGVFVQEKARFGRVSVVLKGTAASVKDAAGDITTVAKSIHPSDLQPVATDVKAVVGLLGQISTYMKLLSNLRASSH